MTSYVFVPCTSFLGTVIMCYCSPSFCALHRVLLELEEVLMGVFEQVHVEPASGTGSTELGKEQREKVNFATSRHEPWAGSAQSSCWGVRTESPCCCPEVVRQPHARPAVSWFSQPLLWVSGSGVSRGPCSGRQSHKTRGRCLSI